MTHRTLRNFTAFLCASCLLAAIAVAETLVWAPNTEPDVTGYVVSSGVVGTSITNRTFTPTNSLSLSNFARGQYYWFYVQATNSAGLVSGPSALVLSSLMRNVTNVGIIQ